MRTPWLNLEYFTRNILADFQSPWCRIERDQSPQILSGSEAVTTFQNFPCAPDSKRYTRMKVCLTILVLSVALLTTVS
jgi:hypothetical protein